MNNYKVTISYDGTGYKGFQKQPNVDTIEKRLLVALNTIFQSELDIIGSGRTDRGVHALNQTFNFVSAKYIDEKALMKALNSHLPDDILARDVQFVEKLFNARKSAITREYQYLFSDQFIPFYLKGVINKVKFNPDLTKLVGVEKSLIGEHDFENFRKLGSNERSTIRTIIDFNISQVFLSDIYNVSEKYTVYCIKIVGNSFLYSMVRNLVGALFEVFKDHVSLDDFVAMVNKTGRYNYTMAPAKGLCLVKVNY